MVSIGPPSFPFANEIRLKDLSQDAFDPAGSAGKGLAGSNAYLAFVDPERGTSPGLFSGVLNLLNAGARGIGALAGYVVGTGSQLLAQLLSNPTADTRELVRIIRELEARGVNIDSAIGLRALPSGGVGVYDMSNPNNPFPPLLAIIKPDGEIATQRPGTRTPAPHVSPLGNHPDLEWQRLGVSGGDWQPGDIRPGAMPGLDFPQPEFEPLRDPEAFSQRFEQGRREFEERWSGLSESTLPFLDPKTPISDLFEDFEGFDGTGAPELPSARPLHGGASQNDDAAERLREALEAARRIALDPGGFFGDGVDPRDAMYERYGHIGLFAYDVVQAQNSPRGGSGGTVTAAGASATVANYLRDLPADVAAMIVNALADRLGAVPETYREALAHAIAKGDPDDPAIQRARQLLSEAGPAIQTPADMLPRLTPDEEAIVTRGVQAGTFTREILDRFRQANPDMSVRELVIEISMLMQGYPSRLNMPAAYGHASETGAPARARDFGDDPALDDAAIAELDRLIALGESGIPLDPRTEAAAMIADQIRHNVLNMDHAVVMTDAEGRPAGMMVYTHHPNRDDPAGPRVLFIEDIISFSAGQGVGLRLLQEAFDRSEGIVDLISLPGSEEYYLSLGAEFVPPDRNGPFPTATYAHLRWTDRPAPQEQ